MRVAGLMSGTSLDGIDVAIVDLNGRASKLIAHHGVPYSPATRSALLAISNTTTTTAAISRMNFQLGELYAGAVALTCRRFQVPLDSIELIGSHGQTIYHEGVNTLQIGEAAVLAERTGIPVMSDFRTADIAAGGKGAPLVPFVDYRLFRDSRLSRVALNIGGIANISFIPAGASPEQVIAFDTGPGNMVVDALTAELTGGRKRFDRNGDIASQARIDRELLQELTSDPYYSQKPPKTAGREQYGAEFVAQLKDRGARLEDLIATATALTAATIGIAVRRFAPGADELIASGGGVHNQTLMAQLQALLPDVAFSTVADFGIDIDAKEALAFAILAYESFHRRRGNLPSATGARHPAVLGKLSWPWPQTP